MAQLIDFKGTYPYASELFGVFQPLLGWKGRQATVRVDRARRRAATSVIARLRAADELWLNEDTPQVLGPELPNPGPLPTGLSSAVAMRMAAEAHRLEVQAGKRLGDAELRSLLSTDRLSKVLQEVIVDPVTANRIAAGYAAANAATMRRDPLWAGVPGVVDARKAILGHEAAVASTLAWLGAQSPATARALLLSKTDGFALAQAFIDPISAYLSGAAALVLSPLGLVQLYREYFFELDTFLGPPVGHVWVSPGGTLELVEVNTRKVVIEKTTETALETTQRSESSTTQQDDLADAVKSENSQNTRLGVTASASYSMGKVFQAQASGSFGLDNARKTSDEVTHKQMRQQSEKLTSEIRQNFKTTFKTVTETTDTSSRRYLLQNTTNALVNYELRRKMRRLGVQVQHIGTQLCWQVYIDDPGTALGLAQLVHVARPEDDSATPSAPDAPSMLERKDATFEIDFAFQPIGDPGATDDDYYNGAETPDVGKTKYIVHAADYFPTPPAAGYTLGQVTLQGVHGQGNAAAATPAFTVNSPSPNAFHMELPYVNFGDGSSIHFTVSLQWTPPDNSAAVSQYQAKLGDYTEKVRRDTQSKYVELVRDRIEKAGSVKPRNVDDLREEERDVVYRRLLEQLEGGTAPGDLHVVAELVRAMFDIDSMLYFVAQDWWRPRLWFSQQGVDQSYTTLLPTPTATESHTFTLGPEEEIGWGGFSDLGRPNYKITEKSAPASFGASLGWILQLDGDPLRNAFLNAPWVKAVIPIRPGKENDALAWLEKQHVEGSDGLDDPYVAAPDDPPALQNVTVRQAISLLTAQVTAQGTDMASYLKSETVFEHGFDPLSGGFRATSLPFEIFDQWVEVLPTDQVVAAEVHYDPKTGLQT